MRGRRELQPAHLGGAIDREPRFPEALGESGDGAVVLDDERAHGLSLLLREPVTHERGVTRLSRVPACTVADGPGNWLMIASSSTGIADGTSRAQSASVSVRLAVTTATRFGCTESNAGSVSGPKLPMMASNVDATARYVCAAVYPIS